MREPTPQVLASRLLLKEVCALLAPYHDNAVLIGGWVPGIRFPDAIPAHVGSIDVDFAVRASKARHEEVVARLRVHGFRPGPQPYQFVKNIEVAGHSVPVRLDLLTSPEHHAATFHASEPSPFPAAGAEFAFAHNSVEAVGPTAVRVASVVAFVVMKATALIERKKPKDAYDLHFCLEHFPGGVLALAAEFVNVVDDPAVRSVLTQFAGKFRSEEDEGPRFVTEVEQQMGDARAIRKFDVFTRVDDFLRALGVVKPE